MRILHVYKDYPPVCGGIERQIQLLAEGQAQRGHEVTVLVAAAGRRSSDRTERGVRVLRAGRWATAASTPLSPSLMLRIRSLEADVTHLHFPHPPGELGHRFFGRGRRTVISYQSDIVRQRLLGLLYRPWMHRVLEHADAILVSSERYLESSRSLRRHRARCRVVPLAVDTRHYGRADPARVDELQGRFESPVTLFVGRFRYYKGLEVLLEAFQHAPGHLLLVGAGPLEARVRRRAERSPVRDRIHFLGELDDDLLRACYHLADVVVLPSTHRSEAFGLVLVEAMAAGRPVVSTELGTGTSWVNLNGETGSVVPANDPLAFGAAIRELLEDPEKRSRLGRNGRRRARELFDKEVLLDRVLAVYEGPGLRK